MDVEKFYHTQEDEIETLDMKNMAEIIKAIAISSTSIVTGKDTPSRVDTAIREWSLLLEFQYNSEFLFNLST